MASTTAKSAALLALCLSAGLCIHQKCDKSPHREAQPRNILPGSPSQVRMPPALAPRARRAAMPGAAAEIRAHPEPAPRYHDIVEQAGRRHRVSARLIHAIIAVESAYRADAVSHRGAVGLMQLMPATAQRYGFTDLLDPAQNIYAGVQHLRELLELFDGNVTLALAAYHAGAGAVMHYGGIPPYRETTKYVSKVLDCYAQGYGALPSR